MLGMSAVKRREVPRMEVLNVRGRVEERVRR